MRVIAGTRRSMPLKAPVGMDTRPTQDRTKETLFNVLQTKIPGSVFLDLFAGSGAIGIEALSRGAKKAVFVEKSAKAVACIKENLNFTRFLSESEILETDVLCALERLKNHEEFDVIFMDPPYDMEIEPEVLKAFNKMPSVSEFTTIVIESKLKRNFDFINELGYEIEKIKEYKSNAHIFIRKK